MGQSCKGGKGGKGSKGVKPTKKSRLKQFMTRRNKPIQSR